VEILLLHPGALGDIILSLPAIALLRKRFPSAAVTIAGNVDHLSPIVSRHAERILSLSTLPLHRLYAREALPPEEVLFRKSFSRIVSWTGTEDPEFVKKLQAIHPDACVAAWKPQPGELRHVSQLFALSLAIRWLAQRGWNEKHSLTALHPGAGSKEKRWPLSRFISLARKLLLQEKRKLLLIEGPAEKGLARYIEQQLPSAEVILAESLRLSLLAAVIEQCGIFVGNDSGIAHLAAALKVPSVVLFGPTLPQHWAPLGEKVVVLRNPGGCEGCASGSVSGCRKHTCLDNITVEEVLRNLGFCLRN
jgi:ADP-heptose:LPS heptosyltransferase